MRGWIGDANDVVRVLEEIGADTDNADNFIVTGPPHSREEGMYFGPGGDVLLKGRVMYLKDGKRRLLIPVLVKLGYGHETEVF